MSVPCPLCSSGDVEGIVLPYPLFRHLDFTPFHPGPNRLGRCQTCRIVFRIIGEEEQKEIDAIYRSVDYRDHEEIHKVVVDGYNEPVTTAFLQAQMIRPYLPGTEPAVLDIGCFDGHLLSELNSCYEKADLCGFDVDERSRFPKAPNLRFVSGGLERIEGLFDLIVLSHSIQYIRNIQKLSGELHRLLKPGGALFIQVPNFALKPFSLLLGDLYYHYTPAILINLFRHLGFTADILPNQWFPRDILTVVQPAGNRESPVYEEDRNITASLERIREAALRLEDIPHRGTLGVLGTTIEAAFAGYRLGERISYFVDENPGKVGKEFHGKPVVHPSSVTVGDMVLIPMGKSGTALQQRLTHHFRGSYVCV